MNLLKGIKLNFICMKMKLIKNKKYLQQKMSRKVLVQNSTPNFLSRISKSDVVFTCKFPTVMHFVLVLPTFFESRNNFMF